MAVAEALSVYPAERERPWELYVPGSRKNTLSNISKSSSLVAMPASASVGFMSPNDTAKANPTYREVCTGTSGQVEVLNAELNDPAAHFEELIKFIFIFHDPTTLNRQCNDVGTLYAMILDNKSSSSWSAGRSTPRTLYLFNSIHSIQLNSIQIHAGHSLNWYLWLQYPLRFFSKYKYR
jgi:Peptide methionine sulfoxide reductase